MEEFLAVVTDSIGLHARPAAKIAQVANQFKDTTATLVVGERRGNLKSIMNIMALGVKTNTEFKVVVDGPQEKEAIKAIKTVMKDEKLIKLVKS